MDAQMQEQVLSHAYRLLTILHDVCKHSEDSMKRQLRLKQWADKDIAAVLDVNMYYAVEFLVADGCIELDRPLFEGLADVKYGVVQYTFGEQMMSLLSSVEITPHGENRCRQETE